MVTQINAGSVDQGTIVLVSMLRLLGIGADPQQIRHQMGVAEIGVTEMLRFSRQHGLKARVLKTKWERLQSAPLPGIAALRDGGFLLLGKAGDDKILVQAPNAPVPVMMTRAEFEAVWDGRLVLMTRRVGLVDLARRFDITWFLG